MARDDIMREVRLQLVAVVTIASTWRRLPRSGLDHLCGLFFQLDGSRSVKVYPVWADEEDRILFYDAAGQRFAETRLSDAPDPASVAQELPAKKAA